MIKQLRAFIEGLLPWYDRDRAAQQETRSEAIRQRSIASRINAESVRSAYIAYADRLEKK